MQYHSTPQENNPPSFSSARTLQNPIKSRYNPWNTLQHQLFSGPNENEAHITEATAEALLHADNPKRSVRLVRVYVLLLEAIHSRNSGRPDEVSVFADLLRPTTQLVALGLRV